MKNSKLGANEITRRDVLKTLAAGAVAATFGGRFSDNGVSAAEVTAGGSARGAAGGGYNVLSSLRIKSATFVQASCRKTIVYLRTSVLRETGSSSRTTASIRACVLHRVPCSTRGNTFSIRRCSTIPIFRGSPACRRK